LGNFNKQLRCIVHVWLLEHCPVRSVACEVAQARGSYEAPVVLVDYFVTLDMLGGRLVAPRCSARWTTCSHRVSRRAATVLAGLMRRRGG